MRNGEEKKFIRQQFVIVPESPDDRYFAYGHYQFINVTREEPEKDASKERTQHSELEENWKGKIQQWWGNIIKKGKIEEKGWAEVKEEVIFFIPEGVVIYRAPSPGDVYSSDPRDLTYA